MMLTKPKRRVKVYIAGAWVDRHWLRRCVRELELTTGELQIISSWLQEEGSEDYDPAAFGVAAERDLREISQADFFILDTMTESNTGGREVELGFALAHDLPVVRIGPMRNIFHNMATSTYRSWGDYLAKVAGAMKRGVDNNEPDRLI